MLHVSSTPDNPIAVIRGGKKRNGHFINLNDNSTNGHNISDKQMNDIEKLIKNSKLPPSKLREIKNAIMNNKKPNDDKLAELYDDIINITDNNNKEFVEIKLKDDEVLEPMPTLVRERSVAYISGPSGSGKSTWCGKFIANYIKHFPNNNVVVFSNVDYDPEFDAKFGKKIKRIKMNSKLITDPIDIKDELSDSLVIMDDVDMITNPQLKDAVIKLRDEILTCARHYNGSILCTSHVLMNNKATKILLIESNLVTIFPLAGSGYHSRRFCREYASLDKLQTQRLLKLPSRWVTIKKDYPMCIMYDKGAYLLNNDN